MKMCMPKFCWVSVESFISKTWKVRPNSRLSSTYNSYTTKSSLRNF